MLKNNQIIRLKNVNFEGTVIILLNQHGFKILLNFNSYKKFNSELVNQQNKVTTKTLQSYSSKRSQI